MPETQNKANNLLNIQRGKGDINSYQNKDGFFTTQYVALGNSNSNLLAQSLTVARYQNDKNEKLPLITIKKGDDVVARFYNVRGEGDQIFMDILDPSLQRNFEENKISSKEVAISGLELDKKLDVRVKGLGKDLGVLFSAFGFQMQTPEKNQVLKNESLPFDIEVGENFLDKALKNQLDNTKDKGCLLSESMSLNSPTMQGMLRASTFNENLGNTFTKSEKSFADGKVKITSLNYDTTINNQTVKRPIQFIEANGKISTYLSIVDGLTNREKNGRFYEISNIRVTKDNRIFLKITDDSLDTIGGSTPHTRTIEIPHNNDSTLVNYIKNDVLKNKNYENLNDKASDDSVIDTLSTNASLSNKEYGEIENQIGGNTQVFDSAGFIRRDQPENSFENLNEAQEIPEVDKKEYDKSHDINPMETVGSPLPNKDASAKLFADDANNGNPENDREPEPQPEPQPEPAPQSPAGDNERTGDEREGERENTDREADGSNPAGGPPPVAPHTEEQHDENAPAPKKRSALDIPFIDKKDDAKGFDKDKSNALAAKLGTGILGVSAVLLAFSVIIPFLAPFAIAGLATATIVYTKPWELFAAGSSTAVDRANAKLAKEKLKELKRERKAENALAREQSEKRAKNAILNKNQKQIERLNEENGGIDARIAMLERYKRELQTQNGILLTHGRQEGDFKNFNLDEANMTEEEKEQYRALLEAIDLEDAQYAEDFTVPYNERAQMHKEALYETVENLQNNKLEYDKAQKAYSEAEAQIPIETQAVEKLRENSHVAKYLSFQDEKKKLEDKLATLSTEEEKKAVNNEIANIEKKINSLTLSGAPKKAVEEYLERTDKLNTLNENYETSKQKMEELKAEGEALSIKEQTQRAVVINDTMVEAHKEDKEVMSDEKRMATVKLNTSLISSLDSEIAGLNEIKSQNEKLGEKIAKKAEKDKGYHKKVTKQQEKYERAVDYQQNLTKGIDDYLVEVSDVTKAEQEYVKGQREEAKKSADLILQGYNQIAEKGLTGEELKKALDDAFVHINNLKRTSPPEFSAGYDELRKQGEQRFGYTPERENATGKSYDRDAVEA
ncbi:MAG TPA: hypothetical protein IAC38_03000 [Candidatus Caccovivens faecavium]|nr:hypothetical protein [Candidatus Caccovivens faecavium]